MMMAAMTLSAKNEKLQYVATWTTAIQKVEPHNLAPEPGLSGNSLRQIVEISFGGKEVALKLWNWQKRTHRVRAGIFRPALRLL